MNFKVRKSDSEGKFEIIPIKQLMTPDNSSVDVLDEENKEVVTKEALENKIEMLQEQIELIESQVDAIDELS